MKHVQVMEMGRQFFYRNAEYVRVREERKLQCVWRYDHEQS